MLIIKDIVLATKLPLVEIRPNVFKCGSRSWTYDPHIETIMDGFKAPVAREIIRMLKHGV